MENIPARLLESPDVLSRFEALSKLKWGEVCGEMSLGKGIMSAAVNVSGSAVFRTYFDHLLLVPQVASVICDRLGMSKKEKEEITAAAWIHDAGRLVRPDAYYRTDLISGALFRRWKVPEGVTSCIPPMNNLLHIGDLLCATEEQLQFSEELQESQLQLIRQYVHSLSPQQRVLKVADNLGKWNQGSVFSLKVFGNYVRQQENRYPAGSIWPSVKHAEKSRRAGALAEFHAVQTILGEWDERGLAVGSSLSADHIKPAKSCVVVRHGAVDNPDQRVYNRDADMDHPMHLNQEGRNQMRVLGERQRSLQFSPSLVWVSPEVRARESASELLGPYRQATEIVSREDLDDNYSPGPYREGMLLKQLMEIGGDVYNKERWGRYQHESPQSVAQRMRRVFTDCISSLAPSETGYLISHGDPIAWLIHSLGGDNLPEPDELRKGPYVEKGGAVVIITDAAGEIFSYYIIPSLGQGAIY